MGKTESLSVILLGGTGIIGRELSRVLLDQGYQVYVVSRGARKVVEGAVPIVGDIHSSHAVRELIKRRAFDVVVDLVSFNTQQLAQNLELFEDCAQYMFVSSATVYEDAGQGVITEDSPLITAGWSYPLAKIECENYLKESISNTDRVYTIIRPYITYSEQRLAFGTWEMPDVWRRIQEGAPVVLGNEVTRAKTTLTHSTDLALGMVALMGNKKAQNEIFHITSDESMTWGDVYKEASGLAGQGLKMVDMSTRDLISAFPELSGKIGDRSMNRVFDNSKLYEACPELKLKYSVHEGYQAITGKRQTSAMSMTDCAVQGRMDRLIERFSKDKSVKSTLARYRKALKRDLPGKQALFYTTCYYIPGLFLSLRRLRDAIKDARSNYGL